MVIEYNYVHCSFFSTLVEVSFSFQTRFEIQPDLMLVSGECEVKCNGSRNKCDVSRDYRTMANVSIPEQTAHWKNNEIYC